MTNLAKAAIKLGTVCFYGPDPQQYSALLVTAVGDRVTAYTSAKSMKLDYAPEDLIGADELAAQAMDILKRKDSPHWEAMIAGRFEALAAGLKLQENRELLIALRIDSISDLIRERLAATAASLRDQPRAHKSVCCHKCAEGKTVGCIPLSATRMILCPVCSNKRCPRASNHDLACTGSNEPGQPGSLFGKAGLPKTKIEAQSTLSERLTVAAKS